MGALLWLASYPKSGNTWLRAFLHNFLRNPAESYDINRLAEFTRGEAQTYWYRRLDPRPGSAYSMDDVRRLRPLVQLELTKTSTDTVFVKTHNALIQDEGTPLINMNATAGAIYVVRDPRDVAISYSHHLGQPIDWVIDFMALDGAATAGDDHNVFERLSTWSTHVLSWTQNPSPSLLVLRYEDMLEKPTKSFGSIARFLGVEPSRERLEKAIRLSSFRVLREQEKRKGFSERPAWAEKFFREGKAGQWRKILTAEQRARIERDHGEQMRRHGYLS
jgi:hypothetical protein